MPKRVIRHNENNWATTVKPSHAPESDWGTTMKPSRVPEPKVEDHDPGIYHSFRPTILLANLFGLSPLSNASKRRSKDIEFVWISVPTVYSFVVLCLISWSAIVAFINFVLNPADAFTLGKVAERLHNPFFYISAAASFLLTFNLTRKLPCILRQWDETVQRLCKYSQIEDSRSALCKWTTTNNYCKMSVRWSTFITAVMFSSGVIEHVLHDLTEFNKSPCRYYYNSNNDSIINGSMSCQMQSFIFCCMDPMNGFITNVLGYYPLAVTIAYVTQKFATFSWNYHDLLLIQISSALTVNFKVLAEYVKKVTKNKETVENVDWKQLREDHVAMCEIVHMLDDALAPIVLFSYVVNVYFVAIQIFFGVHLENRNWVEIGYIVMSFTHIIGRMITVTSTASNFYEQAYDPLINLLHLPSDAYSIEIKRLIDHLSYCTIGLTGWKMFAVNRQLFLAITSLIFTYELLLLDVE